MPEPPRAPIEWITGEPRFPWLAGLWLSFSGAYLGAYWSLILALSWAQSYGFSPRLMLVLQFVAIGLAANALLLWGILVPMPATRFGVSPEGVTIDYGLRSESWPWSRAFVRGRRLEVVSARFGFSSRFSLTPFQSHRAELLRPRDR